MNDTCPFASVLIRTEVVTELMLKNVVLGDLVVIVLTIGPKDRGFKPVRGRWISKDNKIRVPTEGK
jgi:hypothetical protein